MLKLVDHKVRTNKISSSLLPPKDELRHVACANLWRGGDANSERMRRRFIRAIVTRIWEPGGFVVFHFDSDVTWKNRDSILILDQFRESVLGPVAAGVREVAQKKNVEATPSLIESLISRILLMVPHYSIESWLYQAADKAIAICRERHQGSDVAKFESWRANRGALDEVDKPKGETCLRWNHNEDLAPEVPLDEVYCAGKSFYAVVEEWTKNQALRFALQASHYD